MSTAVEEIVKPYHQTDGFSLYEGDCRSVLPIFADCSVDSVVCDPPYELGFMGKGWDRSGIAYDLDVWRECLRVLKPGGHLLAFGGSRTYHRLACAIEDAGFDIRDQIQWIYGSGFPKSLDVSKAIDAAAGAEREVIGMKGGRYERPINRFAAGDSLVGVRSESGGYDGAGITAPATDLAKQWNGWGTALKPAHEPIVLARKPLIGTVAQNILEHGTGGLNIDGCRIELSVNEDIEELNARSGGKRGFASRYVGGNDHPLPAGCDMSKGRWPANVIHDGSEEVLAGFPETTSGSGVKNPIGGTSMWERGSNWRDSGPYEGDSGSAARFFYCAKASQEDRNEGCEDLPMLSAGDVTDRQDGSAGLNSPRAGAGRTNGSRNAHPTVKPTELMRHLCRLVTPPGGTVLDPLCGSGSTGKAAMLEGLRFIGIELSAEYCELAQRRIEAVTKQGLLFG
jgi:DNA modification methylase